jgi:hypothetical protein
MRWALALAVAVPLCACDGMIDQNETPPVHRAVDDSLSTDESLLAWISPDTLVKPHVQVDGNDRVLTLQNAAALPLALAPPAGMAGPLVIVGTPDAPARLRFDESSSLELKGGYASLTNEISLAAVVRRSTGAAEGRIASLGADVMDEEVSLWNQNDKSLQGLRVTDESDFSYANAAGVQGQFQILVITAGQVPGSLHLFVDGHYAGAATPAGAPGSLAYVARNLMLNHPASPTDFELGELLVFRRQLSSAEVNTLDLWLASRWNLNPAQVPQGDLDQGPVTFNAVHGILRAHGCIGCHYRGNTVTGGIVLDDYAGISHVVKPGDAQNSLLWINLPRMQMQLGASPLLDTEKQEISDWITQGAAQ